MNFIGGGVGGLLQLSNIPLGEVSKPKINKKSERAGPHQIVWLWCGNIQAGAEL